jgi:hypothetical protein
MDDDTAGARWMTYAELAEARGISLTSATRMAFRRKWKRQPGNDGTARVAVPIGQDGKPTKPAHGAREADQDGKAREPGNGVTLAAIGALRAELDREHGRADALQAELVTEKEARARAEGREEAERQRADRAEAEASELRTLSQRAEQRAAAVEADAAQWWRQSRWRRLKAAWRGRT